MIESEEPSGNVWKGNVLNERVEHDDLFSLKTVHVFIVVALAPPKTTKVMQEMESFLVPILMPYCSLK